MDASGVERAVKVEPEEPSKGARRQDPLVLASLIGGFTLLVAASVGALVQRPSFFPSRGIADWFLEPHEQNSFLKSSLVLANVRRAFFVDSSRGWAVGEFNYIAVTRDGGQTWATPTTNTFASFYSVFASGDGRRVWVVGNGGQAGAGILASRDGGRTWNPQNTGASETLQAIAGTSDGLRLWAAGNNGTILASRDGGRTWNPQNSGTSETLNSFL